ncbi:hypothetical protein VTK73DRAFT_9967 [Phialemonium thermophilum]|uniref:PH domain-containing protein n=1 Tax=Phialemonium thermophilum TaxID=223376 RepID=A0ABR3VZ60_9PEZI
MEPYDGSRDDALLGGPPRPRRMSMDEDYYYQTLMTHQQRPPRPPSYDAAMRQSPPRTDPEAADVVGSSSSTTTKPQPPPQPPPPPDVLPGYSCDVHIEGVFMRKMEIEETTKRAEYRNWHMVYVVLHGTALNIYQIKKDRGWWSTKSDGPNISPDNPPWIRKASLEKAYSLLHADAGIAADYRKRRHVIRVRAEADQFLLSCVELSTFVTWLDKLFAAIDVAAPIDERDFPRDQSVPRAQRIQWLRSQHQRPDDQGSALQQLHSRRQSTVSNAFSESRRGSVNPEMSRFGGLGEHSVIDEAPDTPAAESSRMGHPLASRLSTTSYPNESIDPETGKWRPRHTWTVKHDHLYAKLCFSVLLFKSPRKSNYIVTKGKLFFVDWSTVRQWPVADGHAGEQVHLSSPPIGRWSGGAEKKKSKNWVWGDTTAGSCIHITYGWARSWSSGGGAGFALHGYSHRCIGKFPPGFSFVFFFYSLNSCEKQRHLYGDLV